MEHNWKVVFTDTFLPKVELVKAMLFQHDIPSILLNQQDSAHRTFGEIQLLVDRENYLKALHLINSEVSNFWQRAITGTLFVIVLLGAMLWNKYSIALLLFPVSLIGLNEFYTITRTNKTQIPKNLALTIGGLIYLIITSVRVFDLPSSLLSLCILCMSAFLIVELFRAQKRPITNISYGIFGILYIVVPFALLNYIPLDTHGAQRASLLLVAFFASLWCNDTGAYLTGRSFGKTKLFERISPNKTWEGFFGGLFFCVLAGYIFSRFDAFMSPLQWICFSLIIGIFGTLGDLVESMIKRNYNIKDSGTILPGHGGILDRFDGIFLASPLIIAYLESVPFWK